MKIKHIRIILLFFFLVLLSVNNFTYGDNTNIKAPFFEETIDSVCLGGTYNWRGSDYFQAGEYYDSLLTVGGEDSVYKLTLSVYTIYKNPVETICNGDSAFLQGEWQKTEGIYYDTVVVANDCDTVIGTQLFIEYNQSFQTETLCQGDSIFLEGEWQYTSGMYRDTLTSQNDCDSISITVVNFYSGGDTTINRNICEGDSVLFGGKYYFEEGIYIFTEIGTNGCDSTITLELAVTDLPDINATADPATLEEGKTTQLFVENYGPIIWTPDDILSCSNCNNPIASPLGTTTFFVEMEIGNCTAYSSVTVTVVERYLNVEIPEGFSPNGDGINDYFEILFIEEYPYNSLTIFNRWGNKVEEISPYRNTWDGKNKFGGSIGDDLPEGTYYYVLKLDKRKEDIIKGYIFLKR